MTVYGQATQGFEPPLEGGSEMARPVLEGKVEIRGSGIRTLDTFARFLQTGPELLRELGATYPLRQPPSEIPNLFPIHLKFWAGWRSSLSLTRLLPIGPQAG